MYGINVAQRLFLISLFFLSLSQSVSAASASMREVQLSAGDLSGMVEAVHLEVHDEVQNGCWTNISEIEETAIRVLASHRITTISLLEPSTAFHPALIISATGSRINDSYCLVQSEITVSFMVSSRFADATSDREIFVFSFPSVNTIFRSNVAFVATGAVNQSMAGWVEQTLIQFANQVSARRAQPGIESARGLLGPED